MEFTMHRLDGTYWIAKIESLPPELTEAMAAVPKGAMWSFTHTSHEMSLVSVIENPPGSTATNGPWTAFRVAATLDFAFVGILNLLTLPLRDAGISVFALSTYDTNHLLVPEGLAEAAIDAWMTLGTATRLD